MVGNDAILRVSSEARTADGGKASLSDLIGRHFLNADMHFADPAPTFNCTMWRLADVGVMTGRSSRVRITSHRSDPPDDGVILAAGMAGDGILSSRGRELRSGDGTAMLVRAGEPRWAETGDGWAPRHIRLPAARLAQLVPALDDRIMRPIPADHPALVLLGAYLPLVCRPEVVGEPALAATAATHICDLVALAIGCPEEAAREARARSLPAVRAANLRQWIRGRLGDCDLTLEEVARAHGVAPRTVQGDFQRQSTSFSAVLLAERLDHARRALADPAQMRASIADIAFAAGFGDLSYFNRSFRRRFGCTPSEARHER